MPMGRGHNSYRLEGAATQPLQAGRPSGRWILFIALGLGLVRFFQLGEWSLWHDEALALSDALDGPRALGFVV